MRICAKRKNVGREHTVAAILNLPSEPFHGDILIVCCVEAQVDTRNRPIAVLDAIFFVDVNVNQTKHDAFEQALINWQLHASLFFKWGKTSISLGGTVIPASIGMCESVRDHGIGGITLKHHAPEAHAYRLHAAFNYSQAIMTIRRRKFMFDAFITTKIHPLIAGINKFVVRADIGQFPRRVLVVQQFLQIREVSENIPF